MIRGATNMHIYTQMLRHITPLYIIKITNNITERLYNLLKQVN